MTARGSSKWLCGAKLSWVDFFFAELIDFLDKISEGLYYQEFPAAKQYFEDFTNLPRVSEYWNSDRCMKTPFNNKMAKLLNE